MAGQGKIASLFSSFLNLGGEKQNKDQVPEPEIKEQEEEDQEIAKEDEKTMRPEKPHPGYSLSSDNIHLSFHDSQENSLPVAQKFLGSLT